MSNRSGKSAHSLFLAHKSDLMVNLTALAGQGRKIARDSSLHQRSIHASQVFTVPGTGHTEVHSEAAIELDVDETWRNDPPTSIMCIGRSYMLFKKCRL